MKPGAYPGLTDAQYDQIDALRSSTLKRLYEVTPAHVRYEMDHPPADTEAQDVGSALHCAILEPDQFECRVVPRVVLDGDGNPYKDFRSKAAQAARAAFEQKHAGKIILRPVGTETTLGYRDVLEMRDAVYENEFARRLLHGNGRNELTIVWQEESGILGKARLDRVTGYEGWLAVVDLKTSADTASPAGVGRAAARFGWDIQAAWYLRGLDALYGEAPRRFFFIVIEKKPPYLTAVHEFPQDVENARPIVENLLQVYAECERTGRWPGYIEHDAYQSELPRWARKKEIGDG